MGEKKKIRPWMLVAAIVALVIIAGVVLGVVALTRNSNVTTTTSGNTPTSTGPATSAEPVTPTQPAQPALGSAWSTFQAFFTDLQHGDYAGAYNLLDQADRDAFGSASAFQSQVHGNYDPSYFTPISESNDGQMSTLTWRNNSTGKVSTMPFYNEGGSWHLSLTEQTTAP